MTSARRLLPHQDEAMRHLKPGSILVGGTGSGKSYVGVTFYYNHALGGGVEPKTPPKDKVDLYVITTARKRDETDWDGELSRYGLSRGVKNPMGILVVIDSWNNIKKYKGVSNAFFIFDEQKAIGSGTWARSFITICKKNEWVMLSATPADRWMDLVPVFVAKGYFKNRTQFLREHVVFAPYVKYPKIVAFKRVQKLKELKRQTYVIMNFNRKTTRHVETIKVHYDREALKKFIKTEWHYVEDRPVRNDMELRHLAIRLVTSHPSRSEAYIKVLEDVGRLIVFYNYNYELDILRSTTPDRYRQYEYNGHKHDPVPNGDDWVYFVQYTSGSEAWECFTTNHMLFYSINYSYRITTQAMGRIDRITTKYDDLYYYRLVSHSTVDISIQKAYETGQDFNLMTLDPRDIE